MNEDTPKHNAEEIEARITALLLGELTSAEEAEVRRAIESNPNLARVHERLKHAIDLVREAVAQPAEAAAAQQSLPRMSEERRQKLLQQFKTVTPKELSPPGRRDVPWVVPMSIAAALMALLTLGRLVSWDEFSNYEPKALLFPRVLAKRQLSERAVEQLNRRGAMGARSESGSRSLDVNRFQIAGAAPTTEPLNRRSAGAIYLPGQTDADKPVEVAQNASPTAESAKKEPEKQTTIARRMMMRYARAGGAEGGGGGGGLSSGNPLGAQAGTRIQSPTEATPIVTSADGGRMRQDAEGSTPATIASPTDVTWFGGTAQIPSPSGGLNSRGGVTSQAGLGGGGGGFSRNNTLAGPSILADGLEAPASKVVSELEQGLKPGSVAGSTAADAGVTQNVNAPAPVISAIPAGNGQTTDRRPFPLGPVSPPVNLGDAPKLGSMFATPAGAPEFEPGQSDKPGSLPLNAPALVAGTSGAANSQTSPRPNFYLAPPSPPPTDAAVESRSTNSFSGRFAYILPLEVPTPRIDALDVQSKGESFGLQDGNVSLGVSPHSTAMLEGARKLREEDLKTSKEKSTLYAADGLGVDPRVQDINFIHGYKDIAITGASSAPVPSANALPAAPFMNESVLQNQVAAPPGGTSDSRLAWADYDNGAFMDLISPDGTLDSKLAERSKAQNSKQDGLAQSVTAGKPTEGSSVSSSSAQEEVPRPFFMNPQMIARYFGGKMPQGSPSTQPAGKAGSPETMSEEKGALAAPTSHAIADQVAGVNGQETLARLNREQEQLGNSLERRKALEQSPDNVAFAKTLSSEGKNVTQLGEPEKDKLAKQRLAEVELRADRQSSSTSNKSAFYSLSLAKEAKQLEQEQKRAYASKAALMDVIQPDSARTVNQPPPPEPQPDVPTQENAFSTFSLNVTDVSFKLAAASLEKGALPAPATVRSEEFINAFNYRDPEPALGAPVAFAWERAQYPYAHNRELIRFAVRTAARGREAGRPLNLVLLLDNSGSMERADRVRIIREALVVLARQLQAYDRISVVAFARTARLWVEALPGNQAGELAERVGNLPPDGGTNLEEALNLAYATAASHFLSEGVNRVVLLTDGAANLGDVDPESLRRKVESWRQRGVALDCFGIGWEGYNDDLLEVLSRNGDGRYGFVNTPEEATTEFAAQLAGALQVAASDVKVQVEFNPRRVEVWRQIGYTKHQLTKQQFRDNTVDAAELAAAESGNALYVIQVNPNGVGPIGMVRVRYREPDSGYYREHEWPVPYTGAALPLDRASATLRLAATASAFSEWVVSSPFAGEVTPDRLLNYLQGVPAAFEPDPRPQKLEWMIRQAKSISGK